MNLLPSNGAQTFDIRLQNIGALVEERGRRRKINKDSRQNWEKYAELISQQYFSLMHWF